MLASAQEWLHAKPWSVPHIMKQGSVVRFIVSCLLIDRRLPTKLQVKNSLIFFSSIFTSSTYSRFSVKIGEASQIDLAHTWLEATVETVNLYFYWLVHFALLFACVLLSWFFHQTKYLSHGQGTCYPVLVHSRSCLNIIFQSFCAKIDFLFLNFLFLLKIWVTTTLSSVESWSVEMVLAWMISFYAKCL